jgi:hypothetical protein
MNKLKLSIAFLGAIFIGSAYTVNAAETAKDSKPLLLCRGVEVDLVIQGIITSRQHPGRKTRRIYVMKSFKGGKHGIPRQERDIAAGINLKDYDNKAVKIKVRALPVATGDLRSTAILKLLSVENLKDDEAQALKKQGEESMLAEKTRTFNPSPNAMPYSGTWGVRMSLPSAKWPDQLEKFNVTEFIKQISKLNTASYVILNVTHPADPIHFTGPHPQLEKILNTASHIKAPSFPSRDLLGEVLDAVRATGKKTIVYFASEGYHTAHAPEKLQDVWFKYIESKGMSHYEAVRKLILKHYVDKYGSKIDGWWFDGSGGVNKAERLLWRKTVLTGNPKGIVAFNRMAGPPFNSSAECDYFGGHPTPRSRNKFWDPVNLPMITAVEGGPWMSPYGKSVKKAGNGALSHVFIGLQDRWTLGACKFPPKQAIEWTSRVVSSGGMYTWSVPRNGDQIAHKQFSLLLKINAEIEKVRKKK